MPQAIAARTVSKTVGMRFIHVGGRHGQLSSMFAICSYRFRAARRMSSERISY